MPRGDKSGPRGQGSQTGRGMGSCSGQSGANGMGSGMRSGRGAGRGSGRRGAGVSSGGRGSGRGSGRGLGMSSGNQGGNYQRQEGLGSFMWRLGQGMGGFFSRLLWQLSSHADYDRYKDRSEALEEEKRALKNKMNALDKGRDNRLNA